MTTAIATKSQQDLMPSLPADWLLLLGKRRETVWEKTAEGAMQEVAVPLPPEENEALRQAKSVLEQRLAPADRKVVISALARIANHSSGERTPAQWQMLFEDFWADLQEFSNVHILEAINAHRRESNWFPKVCELRKRCVSFQETDRWRMARVSSLLDGGQRPKKSVHCQQAADTDPKPRRLSDVLPAKAIFEPGRHERQAAAKAPTHRIDPRDILATRDPEAVERLHNFTKSTEQA